jgi:hypothetical protein
MGNWRIARNGIFGWVYSRGRFATPADFPRHGCSPYRGVRRGRFGALCLVQGLFSVAPCHPNSPIRNLFIANQTYRCRLTLACHACNEGLKRTACVFSGALVFATGGASAARAALAAMASAS